MSCGLVLENCSGPFVDMIPAVLAPLIAKRLSKWADYVGPGTEASPKKLQLGGFQGQHQWDPILVGLGEFTTQFRLPIFVRFGMFTGAGF